MTARVTVALAIVIAIGYSVHRVRSWWLAQKFLIFGWRFLTGHPLHGHHITDAGWFRPGQRALTPTGHATRWQHLPRIQRTAHRTGGAGLFFRPPVASPVT